MRKTHRGRLIGLAVAGVWGACLPAVAQTTPKPGTPLFKDPSPSAPPTFGWWNQGGVSAKGAGASGAKATWDFRKEGGQLVCMLATTDQGAAPQFDGYTGSLAQVPAGTPVKLTYQLSGTLSQPRPNARPTFVTTISLFGHSGGSHDIVFSPSALGAPVVLNPAPLTGRFGPLSVSVVFLLPANTDQIKVLNTLTNAVGSVELKGVSLTVAPPGEPANVPAPAGFESPEQADAEALAKYAASWAQWKHDLGIPDPDSIYTPKPALSGPHPRYLFPALPLARLKARMNDPAQAAYKADLFAQADAFAASVPARPNMDAEDPLRDYADRLPWIALAYLATEDAAKKKRYLAGAVALIDAETSWGPPAHDLPLSQMMLGMGAAYDWLYGDLPAATRAKARLYLIASARFMRSPRNLSAWQWRSQAQWLANHKWFNYAALAMASAALWGDTQAPLAPGEPKLWMDEAMQVFWVVRKTFGPDGAPVEGYNYQEYGLRPYLDFAALTGDLTTTTVSFVDMPGLRNLGVSRLHSLLPGNAGFFTYADSYPRAWGSSLSFRFAASRFHDPQAQLLADIMDGHGGGAADVSENYDAALPPYQQGERGRPDGAAPIFLDASLWRVLSGGGKAAAKAGAL